MFAIMPDEHVLYGNYLFTCKNVGYSANFGPTVYASCPDANNHMHDNKVVCDEKKARDVVNDNGILRCIN